VTGTGMGVAVTAVIELADFNALPGDAAGQALRDCCSSGRWIDAVAAGRPYRSAAELLAASDAAVAQMSEPDLRDALAGHPRIGERLAPATGSVRGEGAARPGGHGRASWSSQEQARVGEADAATRQALADGNLAYEQRFGHIYLACATGRSADELLAFLRDRLGNDRETEWRVVAAELAKINRIRLRKLIGDQQ
jgi:2-oxo-4-hydroxy-4-carboxy-5-ureidoimidazoline decarboxylase